MTDSTKCDKTPFLTQLGENVQGRLDVIHLLRNRADLLLCWNAVTIVSLLYSVRVELVHHEVPITRER